VTFKRHMQIIYEVNGRFLKEVETMWPNDWDVLSAVPPPPPPRRRRCWC
jgi:glucan phosphorylase